MIGFLPSFSAEVVIWGSFWWLCWRSEERQSAGLTLAEQYSQTHCLVGNLNDPTTASARHRANTFSSAHICLSVQVTLHSLFNIQCLHMPVCYRCNRNRLRHWETSAERIHRAHRTCLLSYSLLSHTPLWPNADKLLGWCYIFNESRVFDLPMFIFFDVNWHSKEQPALNVAQHEDRLIHYPLTGEACGWEFQPGGLISCNSLEWYTCTKHVASLFLHCDLSGHMHANVGDRNSRRNIHYKARKSELHSGWRGCIVWCYTSKHIVSHTPIIVPAVDLVLSFVFIRHWVNRE